MGTEIMENSIWLIGPFEERIEILNLVSSPIYVWCNICYSACLHCNYTNRWVVIKRGGENVWQEMLKALRKIKGAVQFNECLLSISCAQGVSLGFRIQGGGLTFVLL
jgi:hypothetical protein